MATNQTKPDITNKIARLILNFAHEELLNQFLNTGGECQESTFCLLRSISSNEILESGVLTRDHKYKFLISYLAYKFSLYLKTNDLQHLLNIKERIFDEDATRIIPVAMVNDFRKACLKTMAYQVKSRPDGDFVEQFTEFIEDQDLVGDLDAGEGYTNKSLYKDICKIIKIDKHFNKTNEQPLLKAIIAHFDKICGGDESYIESDRSILDAIEKTTRNVVPPPPAVQLQTDEIHDQMMIDDVLDNEIAPNANASGSSEKENGAHNSEIIINKIKSPAKPLNDRNGNITISVTKALNEAPRVKKKNVIISEDEEEERCQTPKNTSKQYKSDDELRESPKTTRSSRLRRRAAFKPADSGASSDDDDEGLGFRLSATATTSTAKKRTPKKKNDEDMDFEMDDDDVVVSPARRRSPRKHKLTGAGANENEDEIIMIIDSQEPTVEVKRYATRQQEVAEQTAKSPVASPKKKQPAAAVPPTTISKYFQEPTTSKEAMKKKPAPSRKTLLADDDDASVDVSSTSFAITNFKRNDAKNGGKQPMNKPLPKERAATARKSRSSSNSSFHVESVSEYETAADEENLKQKKRNKTKRVAWGDNEIIYLVHGVECRGKGFWSQILTDYKDHFKNRTNVDLKDKYRNLEKHPSDLQHYKKQAKILDEKIKKQKRESGSSDKPKKSNSKKISSSSSSDSE